MDRLNCCISWVKDSIDVVEEQTEGFELDWDTQLLKHQSIDDSDAKLDGAFELIGQSNIRIYS